jgi:peptide methionine sulfoxide reductase MsrA
MQPAKISNKPELGSEVHEESLKIPYDALVISNKKLKESLYQLKDKKNKEIDVIAKSLINAQFRSQSLLIEIDECKNYINSYNKDIIIKSKAIKSIVSSINYNTKSSFRMVFE